MSTLDTNIDVSEIDPNVDRLAKSASPETATTAIARASTTEQELERISHYQDTAPLVPGSLSWGARTLRSATLDKFDESISDRPLGLLSNVSLPGTDKDTTWDIEIEHEKIKHVTPHDPSRLPPVNSNSLNADSALLTPSLCHPHVHIDKAFLLSHPRYAHLQIERGGFDEAMHLTSEAKADFTQIDLIERGQRLIDESIAAGVTHMRVFVELDKVVDTKCLDAALVLKRRVEMKSRIRIQICAFAQLPLFTTAQQDIDGQHIRMLLQHAASLAEVEVLGSTPYVEDGEEKMEKNIEWITNMATSQRKHLDFHLDYNLDAASKPMIWHVVRTLKTEKWQTNNPEKTVVLGHCTRLTLFDNAEWNKLREDIGDLPVSFVGLPTSDLFMMRTQSGARGTLNVPKLIKDYRLNACLGMNNIGNAFTPQGSCDPMLLASTGVGLYQAGTEDDTELLFQCISTRARHAIGFVDDDDATDFASNYSLSLRAGSPADLLLFQSDSTSPWRTRHSISDAVYLYDGASQRRLCSKGILISG